MMWSQRFYGTDFPYETNFIAIPKESNNLEFICQVISKYTVSSEFQALFRFGIVYLARTQNFSKKLTFLTL